MKGRRAAQTFAEQRYEFKRGNAVKPQSGSSSPLRRGVERALQSMHVDHLPMAWCWSTEAAMAAGLTERARTCAASSMAAVSANDEWDRVNGLFWAAMAAREAKWEEGRANVRAELRNHLESSGWFRNQVLQAAAVSGCTDFLKARTAAILGGQPGSIRIGNLALALADIGLHAELTQLLGPGGIAAPSGEPDSIKRFVWALALSGRHAEALDALDRLYDPVEQSKAIARIVGIIAGSGDNALLDRLSEWIEKLIGHDERTRARLVRAWWTVGAHDRAIAEAETAMAAGDRFNPMMDPRVEACNEPTSVRNHLGNKTARRAMVTSRAPLAEQSLLYEVERAAKDGDLAKASALVEKIKIPTFKARALGAVAEYDPGVERARRLDGRADLRL